ncbi:asparagine--tRNA ligase [Mesotoga sp. Brook.08.YT.4.2.5.1]|nr:MULTISPECIES: asparagine--tRNA ligase [unclassified Mesotoga]RAM58687.1 asparagine--tRNA ligase [Mesotoga sp. SC_4PWL113PWK15]PNE19993.1 asparagine--tRNA ligase [Mesotoga sp. Brook.08.YT.4.2.5.1]PNS41172.1 asparagine--tRNA ligase [Mesotoga sp. B105.6.4]PVD17787.1 asparaginyl-tRNA synthase [Mesotoga sp. Brook.08.105.5.1]RAO95988.1 asparaginyl-tRNA synthase [Mesotoga sp. Brook.08.YT.4.2.5.4.]
MRVAEISSLSKHINEHVQIRGWLRRRRSSGKIQFLFLRDGSGFIQGIVEKSSVPESVFQVAASLKMESSVIVSGLVKAEERAPGGVELFVEDLQIIQIPEKDFPINKPDHSIDFLMDNRHLWLRTQRQTHVLKIRHEIIRAVREFYNDRGFVLIDTPIFTGSIGESAGNTFEIDYFDYGKAYLAQTGQLYLEAAAMALGKVYNLGPTFRAEKSKTRRHLIEFWMNEAEVAYYGHDDNIKLQEELVTYVVKSTLERAGEDLKSIGRDTSKLEKIETPFPRITYDEAVRLLQNKGFEINWGDDIGGDEETAIANEFDKPIVVERYPRMMKAFYMQPDPERPEVVLCDDMLAPEGYGEIIGASERIYDRDLLIERINEYGLDVSSYDWYLDLRDYGTVPHSGFGMGIERIVAWIAGLEHIREAIPFARTLYRIHP